MSKTLDELLPLVQQWFKDKGIIEKSSPLKQLEKTQEELTETRDAVVRYLQLDHMRASVGTPLMSSCQIQELEEVKDGIGDVLVTLVGVCMMLNLDMAECLDLAYGVISKRTGKMVDGIFVKDK